MQRTAAAARPPLFLWAPALLATVAMLLPLIYLILRASGAGEGFLELLLRDKTIQLFGRTVILAATVTALAALIAVPLAWLTTRTDLPYRRFWAVLSVVPLVIPSYIGAFTLIAALGPRGVVQRFLQSTFGLEFFPSIYGFGGTAAVLTLFTFPYIVLTARASLRGMDPSIEEAARSFGRSSWQIFKQIILPQLRPAVAAGGLLVALYTVSDFGAVSMLRFDTFTREIYLQYQTSFDRSFAAALALFLVALTLLILAAEIYIRGQQRYDRTGAGAARPPTTVKLGPWRWPALIFCGLVVLVALVVPVSVVGFWLVRGLLSGETLRPVYQATVNSVYASGLAAVASVLIAVPVAYLVIRFRSLLSRAVERITYAGYGLPGIVIALALVFFGVHYARPLYQTVGLLVLAYVIRFLPQAVGSAQASLLQINPHLEEAARSLGRSQFEAVRTVTAPLVRPGILAGIALVFLTAMKELPATLLLAPIEFDTLATIIWGASFEAYFARAAGPALILLLISSLSIFWLISHDEKEAIAG